MKIVLMLILSAALACADTSFAVKSFADNLPITQSRFASVNENQYIVDYSDTSSLVSVNFATQIALPDGATSVTITALATTLNRRINGVNIAPATIGLSKYNPEGDVSKPSIFVTNSAGVIVSTTGANVLGTSVSSNPKYFCITEYGLATVLTNAKPVLIGDFCEVVRTFSGSYVLNGVLVPFTNQVTRSKVIVFQKKLAVATIYETPANTESVNGGSFSLPVDRTSLSLQTYLKDWWIETASDYNGSWGFSAQYGVTADAEHVIITFPGEHRWWRIVATPSTP